jgi:simple sugar transport system permease protein
MHPRLQWINSGSLLAAKVGSEIEKDMNMTNKVDTKKPNRFSFLVSILTNRFSSMTIAVILALLFTCLLVWAMKANPIRVFQIILSGAFGSSDAVTQVLQAWVPLVLASIGLMFTFTAGLWNIGMEGQIEMGAIFTYGIIRVFSGTSTPGGVVILLAILSGIIGGAFWALLVGLLKNFGGVNEIFGGLGFNFIADAVMLFLVYGPWKPAGVANGSTKMLDKVYWLPQIQGTYLSLWALGIAIVGIIITAIILKGTYFGLKLKAVGKNNKSSFLLGIPTNRYMLLSFVYCGIFAGLVGALQVTGFNHVLRNNISGGYGYLGLMVGMLANIQPLITAPIAFVFIALSKGATGLGIDLKLDSNLSGVIQGSLVIFVLIMDGVRRILTKKNKGARNG